MDLKSLSPVTDEVTVKITDPRKPNEKIPLLNEDGSEMKVVLYAPHTPEYKQYLFTQMGKNSKIENFSDVEELSVEFLANITKSWNITYDGDTPEFSVEKAVEIYSDLEIFWFRPMVEEGLNNFQVFTKA